MAYKFTTINDRQVQVDVAAAFYRLDAAFREAFPGLHLIVAEGTRSREKQAELYAAWVRHRDHGGPKAPLAAPPGQSNHDVSGPRGPRALDVWDSGTDPGVTKLGTARANWLRANAPRFGFDPAGYGFVRIEPWHIEFTGALTNAAIIKEEEMPLSSKDVKRIATQVWRHGNRGAKADAVYESQRFGKKGVRTHGTAVASTESRLGRIELEQKAQNEKFDRLLDKLEKVVKG